MKSLVRRTISAVLFAELLCALVFSAAAVLHERNARLRALDVLLEGRSDSLLGAVQDAEDPEDNVQIDPAELRVAPEDVFAVYNQGGRLLGTSRKAPSALIQREVDGFTDRSADGQTYRVYQREAMRVIDRSENRGIGLERPVTILYAAPISHLWSEIFQAVSFYMFVSLLLFAGTAALMLMLLPRVLRPLEDLATEAAAVSLGTLHFSPPQTALQLRELKPLAITLSRTIDGLRQAVEQEHRFVSDAAHELKTAVAVVRSTIQLQMMRPRSRQEYAAGLERLMTDNARVEALVSQMLLLARIEESPGSSSSSADLAVAVRHAVSAIASLAEHRGVALVLSLTEALVRITADRASVLISNVVVNAIQHSAPGSAVDVVLTRQDALAVLEVKDHGSGISAEALPHLFERFFREDSSRSRETGGAGLGLAIAKSIVDGAGGTISVTSKQGLGTTVTITFRLA